MLTRAFKLLWQVTETAATQCWLGVSALRPTHVWSISVKPLSITNINMSILTSKNDGALSVNLSLTNSMVRHSSILTWKLWESWADCQKKKTLGWKTFAQTKAPDLRFGLPVWNSSKLLLKNNHRCSGVQSKVMSEKSLSMFGWRCTLFCQQSVAGTIYWHTWHGRSENYKRPPTGPGEFREEKLEAKASVLGDQVLALLLNSGSSIWRWHWRQWRMYC